MYRIPKAFYDNIVNKSAKIQTVQPSDEEVPSGYIYIYIYIYSQFKKG